MNILLFFYFHLSANLRIEKNYVINDTFSIIYLEKYPIIKNSDTLYFNGEIVKKDSYFINYDNGTIEIKNSLILGALKIVYYYLPFSPIFLPQISVKKVQKDTFSISSDSIDNKTDAPASNIFFEGKKEIKINYHTREGVNINQHTNFSLNGNIDEIDFEGSFKGKGDKEASFLVKELDNSYLKIKAKNTSLIIGNQNKEINFHNFGKINQQGIGFSFSQTNLLETLNFNYLTTPFRYEKIQFYGKDFIQGPYYLKKDKPIKILPNSERVYLDGLLLKRGSNEDYLIDYELGAITLTNRWIITSRNLIEVDFLYEEEDWEKNNYHLNLLTTRLPIKTEINWCWQKDRDKKYFFDNEIKNYLSKIGNDTTKAYIPSHRYVGKNNGNYEKDGEIFIYVGEKKGSYLVDFTFVGENFGDYEYDNLKNCYYYVGEKKGKYLPYKKINLPKENIYYSLNFSLPINDHFDFQLGGIINQKDENLFSPLGDTNKFSYGANINLNYQKEEISLNFVHLQFFKNYNLLNQLKTEDLINLPLKNKTTFKFNFLPFNNFNFNSQINLITNEKSWGYFGEGRIDFYFNQINFSKNYNGEKRIGFLTTPHYRFFYPTFSLLYQIDNNKYFLTNSLGSSFLFGDKKFFFDYQIEKEKEIKKIIQKIGFNYNQNPQTRLLFGRLKKDNISYFANLIFDYSLKEFLKFDIEWKLTNEEEILKEVRYIKVKKGEGNYSKDTITNEYYPNEKGEYLKEIIPLRKGKMVLKNELKNNLTISLKEKLKITLNTNFLSVKNFSYNFNWDYYFQKGLLINYYRNYFKNNEDEISYFNIENSLMIKKEMSDIDLGNIIKYLKNEKRRIGFYHFQKKEIEISPFGQIDKGIELEVAPVFSLANYQYFLPIIDNYQIKKIGIKLKERSENLKNWYLDIIFNIGYRFYEGEDMPLELTYWEPKGLYYNLNLTITKNISNNLSFNWGFYYIKEGFKEKEINFDFSTSIYF